MLNELITASQLSELADARSKIYGWLSSIYLKIPDRNFVKILMGKNFNVHLASLSHSADLPEEMRDGIKIVEDFIERSKDKSLEELRDGLAVEHTRLFRGVKRLYGPPPPYESVYVEKGLVMGESTAKVKKKYAEAGISLADDLKGEPPDYIGFELDFIRYLCSEEAEAWRESRRDVALKYLNMESRFLYEHLMRWVPKFCDIVVDETKLDFYRGMAKITKGFIDFDYSRADAFISTLKHTKR
ncbi:MAG: molecular chaperone [Candidatus Heimdallarchaeota archaeon]